MCEIHHSSWGKSNLNYRNIRKNKQLVAYAKKINISVVPLDGAIWVFL